LCVEDNRDINDYLCILLRTAGYETVSADTLVEGLRQAKSRRFDLYLLDNSLPDGSGIELCRLIRTFDSHSPILFYSAVTDERAREDAFAAGAQSYISKIEPPNILVQAISELLKSRAENDDEGRGADEVSRQELEQQEFDRLVQRYNSDLRFLMMRASTGQSDCLLTSFLVLKDLYGAIMKLHEVSKLELRVVPSPISLRANEVLLKEMGFRQDDMKMINRFLNSTRETQGREFEELLEEGLPILCGNRSVHLSIPGQ
jgi:CheY-like chemotaxis protein